MGSNYRVPLKTLSDGAPASVRVAVRPEEFVIKSDQEPGIPAVIRSSTAIISELSSSIMLYRAKTQTLTVSVYTEVIRDCFGNAAAYSTVLTVTSVLSMLLFFKLTGKRNISV